MNTISHSELLLLWKRAMRNGAIRRLPSIKRGLFSAALNYTRLFGIIKNMNLINLLKDVAEIIGKNLIQKIRDAGISKADLMLKNQKMLSLFPCIKNWLSDPSYIFWIGCRDLNSDKWIYY